MLSGNFPGGSMHRIRHVDEKSIYVQTGSLMDSPGLYVELPALVYKQRTTDQVTLLGSDVHLLLLGS